MKGSRPSTDASAGSRRAPAWRRARYVLAGIWLLFTVSLTVWWIVYGLDQIDSLMLLNHADTEKLVRQQKMLLWEGATLILSLVGGAAALGYFMVRERREAEQVQQFLATFTHELKTPLASVRLQAEALQDELSVSSGSVKQLLERLVSDTARLSLQLDNSLFLADASRGRGAMSDMRIERISLKEMVGTLTRHWPHLTVSLSGDAIAQVDRRAFESVLQNLFQNAVTHGKARQVDLVITSVGARRIEVSVRNKGVPFQGDRKKLGKLFERFYSGSGSGIGLFLVRTLMRRMGGDARLGERQDGFEVLLDLVGEVQ